MTTRYVLMEENGFELISQTGEYWVSWICHTPRHCGGEACLASHLPWRWVNVFDGHCTYCPTLIPDGILGAWKLHNYENYTKALRIRDAVNAVNATRY